VPVNSFEWLWIAPEHPLSAHECQWASGNSPWTSIECAWMSLSECDHPLSVCECHWVIIECDSPWCDHEKEHICVRIEQHFNAIECTWAPLNEYWIPPECYWACMNSFEWVLNMPWMLLSMCERLWGVWTAPEHPLSVHEHLWVSIWKVWMCTSSMITLTSL
jgi:hypothetical protein